MDADAPRSGRALMWLFVSVHTLLPGALLAYLAFGVLTGGGPAALFALLWQLLVGVLALVLLALMLLAAFSVLALALAPVRR